MKYNKLAIAALVLPFLAACGNLSAPNSNSTVISGAITGMSKDYSSITVSGQTYKLASSGLGVASLSAKAEAAPAAGAPAKKHVKVNGKDATEKALSVGQKVTLTVDANGEASEVDVDLEVRGAVTAVDTVAGTIVVSGRTVKLPTTTRIDLDGDDDTAATGKGKDALSSIKVGDFVEVTGAADANGDVVASKVEVKGAKELSEDNEDSHSELRGVVAGFTAAGSSFTVHGVSVTCSAPACVLPATIADGVAVEAEGMFSDVNGAKVLDASSIKLLDAKHSEEQKGGKPDPAKSGEK